jgi:hypothetical protein
MPSEFLTNARLAIWVIVAIFVYCADESEVHGQPSKSEARILHSGRKILDVGMHGSAAPWICDLDRDEQLDLLVGENFQSRLRIFRDFSKVKDLQFESYHVLNEDPLQGSVPDKHGFIPHVVDLDQDGLVDILSPAWYGMVYWFRQAAKGRFDAGRPIIDNQGNAIKMEWTHGVTSEDWNNDGKTDLIVGVKHRPEQDGLVVLINESIPGSMHFARPKPIRAGDKKLDVPATSPSPTSADWDGDGLFDLLLGSGDGSVRYYRNQGTKGNPRFSDFEVLLSDAELQDDSKVCVVDWDLDGKLDLVVGDHGKQFDKVLTSKEKELQSNAQKSHEDAMANWGKAYATYHRYIQQKAKPEVLEHFRHLLVEANRKQDLSYMRYQEYSLVKQYHGSVWVFLRK